MLQWKPGPKEESEAVRMALSRLDKLLSDSGRFTRSQARDAIRGG